MRMGIETKKVFLRAAKNSKTERSMKGTTIDRLVKYGSGASTGSRG